jgi:hypothetical protein
MPTVHRIAYGFVITYVVDGKKLPSTEELLNSLEPKPFVEQMRDIVTQKVPAKKIEITRGVQTPQFSAERTSFQVPDIAKRFTRNRGSSYRNCGRKPYTYIDSLRRAVM